MTYETANVYTSTGRRVKSALFVFRDGNYPAVLKQIICHTGCFFKPFTTGNCSGPSRTGLSSCADALSSADTPHPLPPQD